ncbi:hypothetical protein ACP70R_032480 [Stipagrostis hirtigluma subsp. patula]
MSVSIDLPVSSSRSHKGHSWFDFMNTGFRFFHVFNESNSEMLVIPENACSYLPDKDFGSLLVVLRNGYVGKIRWNRYMGLAFIVDGWSRVWNLFDVTVGCKAIFSIVDQKLLLVNLYSRNNIENLSSMVPLQDHCPVCSDDSRMTRLVMMDNGNIVIQKTVDPRTIELGCRFTGHSSNVRSVFTTDMFLESSLVLDEDQFFLCSNVNVSPVQKAKLLAIVKDAPEPIPILVVTLAGSNYDNDLRIPRAFAESWLPKTKQAILLTSNVTKETLMVAYSVMSDRRGSINEGWLNLLRNCRIMPGSTIAFQFKLPSTQSLMEAVFYVV